MKNIIKLCSALAFVGVFCFDASAMKHYTLSELDASLSALQKANPGEFEKIKDESDSIKSLFRKNGTFPVGISRVKAKYDAFLAKVNGLTAQRPAPVAVKTPEATSSSEEVFVAPLTTMAAVMPPKEKISEPPASSTPAVVSTPVKTVQTHLSLEQELEKLEEAIKNEQEIVNRTQKKIEQAYEDKKVHVIYKQSEDQKRDDEIIERASQENTAARAELTTLEKNKRDLIEDIGKVNAINVGGFFTLRDSSLCKKGPRGEVIHCYLYDLVMGTKLPIFAARNINGTTASLYNAVTDLSGENHVKFVKFGNNWFGYRDDTIDSNSMTLADKSYTYPKFNFTDAKKSDDHLIGNYSTDVSASVIKNVSKLFYYEDDGRDEVILFDLGKEVKLPISTVVESFDKEAKAIRADIEKRKQEEAKAEREKQAQIEKRKAETEAMRQELGRKEKEKAAHEAEIKQLSDNITKLQAQLQLGSGSLSIQDQRTVSEDMINYDERLKKLKTELERLTEEVNELNQKVMDRILEESTLSQTNLPLQQMQNTDDDLLFLDN